ncbi:MAG: LysR family transcriptional regulator [Clostridiales bacterium]|nr:LysR family transcriptional regulator [Clostridiales bacterium]
MDIIKLKYFYEVAKCQHVTEASENLHIAQPALTKAIKLLEEELGVKLFFKQGRNIKLNDYGKFLKERLDNLLPEFDSIPQKITAMKNKLKTLIRLNVLAGFNIVTEAVVEYKKKNKDIVFELLQGFEEDSDISVFTTSKNKLSTEEGAEASVFEEEVYLALPKLSEYATCSSVKLSDFKDASFISVGGLKQFKTICDDFCAKAGFIPKTTFESDSAHAVRKVIASNVGVGFWPEFSWGNSSHSGVAVVPISEPKCFRKIVVVKHQTGNDSVAVNRFYEFLTNFIAEQQNKSKGKNA